MGILIVPQAILYSTLTQTLEMFHSKYIVQPFATTKAYYHSFFIDSVGLWNSLPNSLVNSPSVQSLKLVLGCICLLIKYCSSFFFILYPFVLAILLLECLYLVFLIPWCFSKKKKKTGKYSSLQKFVRQFFFMEPVGYINILTPTFFYM